MWVDVFIQSTMMTSHATVVLGVFPNVSSTGCSREREEVSVYTRVVLLREICTYLTNRAERDLGTL